MVLDRAIVESLLAQINPDVIELSDKTTLVATAQAARERGVPVVMDALPYLRQDQESARQHSSAHAPRVATSIDAEHGEPV